MNTRILAVCLLAVCATLSLTAQTTLFSDPLASGSASWTSTSPNPNPPNEGGGDVEFVNSTLGYTVGTPVVSYTVNNTGYLTFVPLQTADSSWSVQVDVHLASFDAMDHGDFINLNLAVVNASDPMNYRATIAIDRHYEGGVVVAGFDTNVKSGGEPMMLPVVTNSTTDGTLLISYDATAKTLTFAYDANGFSDSAYNFAYAAATNIGSSWNPSGPEYFGIALVGSSGTIYPIGEATGPTVAAADAYFTNFAIKTEVTIEGTPVPEPSTYAAIAGLLALGFACWRRRVGKAGD